MQQQQQKNWTFCKILRKIKFVTHRDCTTNDLWECDEPCRKYKESRKHLTDATKSLDRKKYVLKRVPVLVIKVSSDKHWFLPKHTLKGMDDVSDGHVLLRSMDGSCQVHSPVMRSWKIISEFEKQQTTNSSYQIRICNHITFQIGGTAKRKVYQILKLIQTKWDRNEKTKL